jgi:hypothetical protein
VSKRTARRAGRDRAGRAKDGQKSSLSRTQCPAYNGHNICDRGHISAPGIATIGAVHSHRRTGPKGLKADRAEMGACVMFDPLSKADRYRTRGGIRQLGQNCLLRLPARLLSAHRRALSIAGGRQIGTAARRGNSISKPGGLFTADGNGTKARRRERPGLRARGAQSGAPSQSPAVPAGELIPRSQTVPDASIEFAVAKVVIEAAQAHESETPRLGDPDGAPATAFEVVRQPPLEPKNAAGRQLNPAELDSVHGIPHLQG